MQGRGTEDEKNDKPQRARKEAGLKRGRQGVKQSEAYCEENPLEAETGAQKP